MGIGKNLHFKATTALTALALMLVLVPAAFGSASSAQTYNGPGGKVIDVEPEEPLVDDLPDEKTVPEAPEAKKKSSVLSFTGFNASLLLGAGVLLVGVGIGTRRLSIRTQ